MRSSYCENPCVRLLLSSAIPYVVNLPVSSFSSLYKCLSERNTNFQKEVEYRINLTVMGPVCVLNHHVATTFSPPSLYTHRVDLRVTLIGFFECIPIPHSEGSTPIQSSFPIECVSVSQSIWAAIIKNTIE